MARYALAGALVAGVYVCAVLLLSGPLHVAIQIAILVAYLLAVCLHFALQRWVVFAHVDEFSLSADRQIGRYIVVTLLQYVATAAGTALLPDIVDISETAAYLLLAATTPVAAFAALRAGVFHGPRRDAEGAT